MFVTSLSTWSTPATLPTFVDPIEKYLLANRRDIDQPAMNQDNGKNRENLVCESLDPASLICVNPYEVNPLTDSADLPYSICPKDIPLKVESSVSQQSPSAISSGTLLQVPPRKIKLEMEEFGDLSPFVSRKGTFTNSVDELNTPTFDKDAFDFDISNYQRNVHADLHVMLKYDASYYKDGTATSGSHQQSLQDHYKNQDIFLNTGQMHQNITILPLENRLHNKFDAIYSPPASENGTYIENLSPNPNVVFDYDMNSSVSVNLDSRNSSPYEQITPDGSECSYKISSYQKPKVIEESYKSKDVKPKLSLDVSLGHQNTILDVSTPNLIAEVVNLEATGFNILDLINEDNLPTPTEELFQSITDVKQRQPLSQPKTQKLPIKQAKRRRSKYYDDNDDDDEDYVPPSKKSTSTKKKKSVQKYDSSDSESEDEKPKKRARGRPPKRTESISSDCSKDSDVSKYRELRDKNNEASRKSRLKRKIKEGELEKEADELYRQNIKLKAQVEELEKMVNNFRDNLFKIMINK